MRVITSIPDDLLKALERIAVRTGRSRGAVCADALRAYAARNDPDWITETYRRLAAEIEESPEEREFRQAAARAVFKASEW